MPNRLSQSRRRLFTAVAILSTIAGLLLLATMLLSFLSPIKLHQANASRIECFFGNIWFIDFSGDSRPSAARPWAQVLDDPASNSYEDDSILGFKSGKSGLISFQVIPGWLFLLAATILPARWISLHNLPHFTFKEYRKKTLCPRCRYDLRATPHTCPECGWGYNDTTAAQRQNQQQAASDLSTKLRGKIISLNNSIRSQFSAVHRARARLCDLPRQPFFFFRLGFAITPPRGAAHQDFLVNSHIFFKSCFYMGIQTANIKSAGKIRPAVAADNRATYRLLEAVSKPPAPCREVLKRL